MHSLEEESLNMETFYSHGKEHSGSPELRQSVKEYNYGNSSVV
jgi:hypothetical protein